MRARIMAVAAFVLGGAALAAACAAFDEGAPPPSTNDAAADSAAADTSMDASGDASADGAALEAGDRHCTDFRTGTMGPFVGTMVDGGADGITVHLSDGSSKLRGTLQATDGYRRSTVVVNLSLSGDRTFNAGAYEDFAIVAFDTVGPAGTLDLIFDSSGMRARRDDDQDASGVETLMGEFRQDAATATIFTDWELGKFDVKYSQIAPASAINTTFGAPPFTLGQHLTIQIGGGTSVSPLPALRATIHEICVTFE